MAARMLLFLRVAVVPVPARCFQAAASSAPRAHDKVGGALRASAVGGPGGTSAVEDVDKRLKVCQAELKTIDDEISEAKADVKVTPDSATKERILAAREERKNLMLESKNLMLKEKASLEAEKKAVSKQEKKEKGDEMKRAVRAATKTFWVKSPVDGEWQQYTIRPGSSWERFFSTIRAGLVDVADANAKPVFDWIDVVEGKEYTTTRARDVDVDDPKAQLNQQENTIANRVVADEDAMGRMLVKWLRNCFPDMVNVPPARTVYKWSTEDAAVRWSDLIESWIKAETQEERESVEKQMADLQTSDATRTLAEFDAVAFSTDGLVVGIGEAKSKPSADKEGKEFVDAVIDLKEDANRGDPAYKIFRGKQILPIFHANLLHPGENSWARFAKENNIVVLTRDGTEMLHVVNRDIEDKSKGGFCDSLKSLLMK